MGLLDWFRRRPAEPQLPLQELKELWGAVGHLGADVETLKGRVEALRDEWANQQDLLRKLVQRLEKRDQRAAAAEPESAPAPSFSNEVEGQRRVYQRNKANGLLPGGQG